MSFVTSTGSKTIVLIHGLWMTPLAWEGWVTRYQALGYTVLTPGYPGVDDGPAARSANGEGSSRRAWTPQSSVYTAPLTGWSGFPENHPLYHGELPPGGGWISQILEGQDLILAIGTSVCRYWR